MIEAVGVDAFEDEFSLGSQGNGGIAARAFLDNRIDDVFDLASHRIVLLLVRHNVNVFMKQIGRVDSFL
jgi:hypothetical protein